MTIRHRYEELSNFKRCCEEAPDGAYESAKELNSIIGDAVDNLMNDLRLAGFKANNCDMAFELEARIYEYVKRSNPESTIFPVSEGFGSAIDGPARDRVIAQATRNVAFLKSLSTQSDIDLLSP